MTSFPVRSLAARAPRSIAPLSLAACLFFGLALAGVPACGAGGDLGVGDFDGGRVFGEDCADGPDAGPGPDGGVLPACPPALDAAEACAQLVSQSCGQTCLESPGCAAAGLLQQYEPDRCTDALGDSQTFPTCELGNCDTLVDKVCGADEQCLDAPGCAPALELQSRGADPLATQDELTAAAAECLQALEDDVVFAPCE